MAQFKFPPLPLAEWQSTRDTIHSYAKVLGEIRGALTPQQKHWWHISLCAAATGLTTMPIPAINDSGKTFELMLDFTNHKLIITTSRGEQWQKPLLAQSPAEFCRETLAALSNIGIHPGIDSSLFSDTTPGSYDAAAVGRYWQAVSQIDIVLKQFKAERNRETSPVQLWPHHFDISMTWFSGRLIPGIDPDDLENAGEQMSFGFSTGDEGISDPYFYITAYPLPDGLLDNSLPPDVAWHTEGWQGALLMYESLVGVEKPEEKLVEYLQTVFLAGSNLMK